MSASKPTYEQRIALGQCVDCGKRPPAPERRKCPPCLEASRVYLRAWHANHPRPRDQDAQVRAYHQDQRAQRQAQQAAQRLLRQTDAAVLAWPHIGHCGVFHRIQTTPMPCPTCGAILLRETA